MRLSKEFAVDRFILISTDKAINPTSVMGVTKRMAELAMQKIKWNLKIKLSLWQFVLAMFWALQERYNCCKEQIAQGGP